MRSAIRISAACLLLLALTGSADAQEQGGFRLIVHRSNPVASLRTAYVSKLFLGKVAQWDHGEDVAPVDLSPRSPVRARFTQAIHGKSLGAIKSYWQQMIFSGRRVPPPELRSDAEVLAHVQRTPGAIGYVSTSASIRNVKAIEILR